jgi:hypothetical protein
VVSVVHPSLILSSSALTCVAAVPKVPLNRAGESISGADPYAQGRQTFVHVGRCSAAARQPPSFRLLLDVFEICLFSKIWKDICMSIFRMKGSSRTGQQKAAAAAENLPNLGGLLRVAPATPALFPFQRLTCRTLLPFRHRALIPICISRNSISGQGTPPSNDCATLDALAPSSRPSIRCIYQQDDQ